MIPIVNMASSVSEALAKGLFLLNSPNVEREESRNGGVSVWDGPVITQSLYPLNRVLFSPMRNANPFFHLFESLWMLGGRNDLPWVAQFNKQMAAYSDDGGKTQPAAYGFRWRSHFGYDQLETVVNELKKDPGSRRVVLGMWDPWYIHTFDYGQGPVHHFGDLTGVSNGSADVPCNTQCYFTARDGELSMAITCRSNDVLWGAHGANAVHFSILLEYLAAKTGLAVGEMTQFSWNYHLYDGILKHPVADVIADLVATDYYAYDRDKGAAMYPTSIFHADNIEAFDNELPMFLDYAKPLVNFNHSRGRPPAMEHPFLKTVALPMLESWDDYKRADLRMAVSITHDIKGSDWKRASNEWMNRRYNSLKVEPS